MKLIHQHINELKNLCRNYHVAELYIFGSVAKGNFNVQSDIDFLVQFSGVNPPDYFDNFMEFKYSLEKLFSRNVDLLEIQTLKNPVLKKSIDRDKILLYGREDSKVAV
jgi:predicted nucleotidyltransferase